MPAKSKHWGDVYQWLDHMIETCDDDSQYCSMRSLIRNFEENYKYKTSNIVICQRAEEFNQHIYKLGEYLKFKLIKRFSYLGSAKYAEERAKNLAV